MAEFALVFPVLLLLLVGIADLARWYTSAIGIESAAREAADFGAFDEDQWAASNPPLTVEGMIERACTAASTLPDYQGDPIGTPGMTCSNPTFECTISPDPSIVATPVACGSYDDAVTGWGCAVDGSLPPCRVTVRLTHTFNLFLGLPPMPSSITFDRKSIFAMSDLG
jgi:Flp pilus assembly protein TadG